jgi:hypothetical protein
MKKIAATTFAALSILVAVATYSVMTSAPASANGLCLALCYPN